MSEKIGPKTRMIVDAGGAPVDADVLGALTQIGNELGYEVVEGRVPSCSVCGFFDCVCEVRRQHEEECRYRKAVTCPVGGLYCKHELEVCQICDPCTCDK